jgi:hypothetical protein
MAKTGTSLIGKADTTLVAGAYKTALSNVGLDMGEVYEQEVEDIKAFGEAFNDIVYATNKSNNDLFAEIKEGSAEMLANIDAGTYTDDEFIEIYSGAVQDLREQMKTIPRGREGEAARAKVRAQLARMKVSAENAEDVLTELATFAKEDQLDQFATSDVDVKLFRDIINKKATRSIVNGELVYTNDDNETITHNQLKERIIKKDHKTTGDLLGVFNNISTYAQQEGAVFNPAYIRKTAQEISSKFTTRAGFLHTINNPIAGMEFSFVQAIGQDEELRNELVTALKNSGVNISDKASAKAIIEELRNPSTQNYALVKGLASQYLAEKGGEIAFNLGKNLRKKSKTGDDETGWLGSGDSLAMLGGDRYLDYNIALDMYDSFKSAKDGKETSFNIFNTKYDYNPKTNEWSTGEGDDKQVFGDSDQFRKSLGISAPEFKELTKGSTVITEDDDINELINKNEKGDTDFTISNFQKTDDVFIKLLENTYDMSDYIVDVVRDRFLGIDDIGNKITIVRKSDPTKSIFTTRTNISNKIKATQALDDFLAFIENEKIKKKNITTTTSGLPTEE